MEDLIHIYKLVKAPADREASINQASFDHVKVGPTPVLALRNLWLQIHMFLDILEFRVENKKKYLEKNCLGNVASHLWKNGINCP